MWFYPVYKCVHVCVCVIVEFEAFTFDIKQTRYVLNNNK